MFNIKLINNDIVIENGDIITVDDAQEIAQQIERTITTRLGEWFLNTQIGLNWDVVFSKPYISDSVENEIRNTILQVADVENVVLTLEVIGRQLEVRFTADYNNQAIEGVTSIG